MEIKELYNNLPLLKEESYIFVSREGLVQKLTENVLKEHLMEIYINDVLTMKVICLPEHLALLSLGRMVTEGIIDSADEIKEICISKSGKKARVYLTRTTSVKEEAFVETTPSSCTGSHILNEYFLSHKDIGPVTPIPWTNEEIFALADAFAKGSPLHEETWATHSCILARGREILFSCEDLGRHNALDKVIGYALVHDIPLNECMVYSSGRVPTDMAIKAVRAGIPILISKAAPTSQAIKLAQEYDLTLICAARRDRMKVFTFPKAGCP